MVNSVLKSRKILLLSFLVFVNMPFEAESNEINRVQQCTIIKSNAKRLECFDNVFGTPIRSQLIDEKSINSAIPNTVSGIFTLAQTQLEQNQFESSQESENELQIAFNNEDDNLAAIYIVCKDNITRFQIALREPVIKNPLKVEIRDNSNGKIVSDINWQNTERGYLLDAGRGLYAIQQLKSLLYIDKFSIVIPAEKRSFIFKNNGLASRVAPIRKECGW